jgi:hypothetical protein
MAETAMGVAAVVWVREARFSPMAERLLLSLVPLKETLRLEEMGASTLWGIAAVVVAV